MPTFSLTLMTTIALTALFRNRCRRGAFARQGEAAALLYLPHNPALRGLALGAAVP